MSVCACGVCMCVCMRGGEAGSRSVCGLSGAAARILAVTSKFLRAGLGGSSEGGHRAVSFHLVLCFK